MPRRSPESPLELQVERARASDAAALAVLAAAAMPDPWSERALRDEIDHPHGLVWLACAAGPGGVGIGAARSEPLGFLAARRGVAELHILMLAVRPSQRRLGIGSALGRTALRWAWHAELDAVQLEVRADNDAAQALYGELGFVVVGTRPRYYRDGEHAVLMTLDLDCEATTASRRPPPRAWRA